MIVDIPKLPSVVVHIPDHREAGKMARKAREEALISLSLMSKLTGICESQISRMENGRRKWSTAAWNNYWTAIYQETH